MCPECGRTLQTVGTVCDARLRRELASDRVQRRGRVGRCALTLQIKRSGTNKYKPMPLTVTEFIRRWLQHVVPCGMHRVRRYGLLHPASKLELEELRLLIAVALGRLHYLLCTEQVVTAELPKMRCECCGGTMVSLGYFPPSCETATEETFPKQSRAPP